MTFSKFAECTLAKPAEPAEPLIQVCRVHFSNTRLVTETISLIFLTSIKTESVYILNRKGKRQKKALKKKKKPHG